MREMKNPTGRLRRTQQQIQPLAAKGWNPKRRHAVSGESWWPRFPGGVRQEAPGSRRGAGHHQEVRSPWIVETKTIDPISDGIPAGRAELKRMANLRRQHPQKN